MYVVDGGMILLTLRFESEAFCSKDDVAMDPACFPLEPLPLENCRLLVNLLSAISKKCINL